MDRDRDGTDDRAEGAATGAGIGAGIGTGLSQEELLARLAPVENAVPSAIDITTNTPQMAACLTLRREGWVLGTCDQFYMVAR